MGRSKSSNGVHKDGVSSKSLQGTTDKRIAMTYSIEIPLSEGELQELLDGGEFNWTFISVVNEDESVSVDVTLSKE